MPRSIHTRFLPIVFLTLATVCPALLAEQWPDGTPIVRFDRRQDASGEMRLVADWTGVPLPRRWAGPNVWTNRLQDWIVRDGALRNEPNTLPMRTAHLITHELVDQAGALRVQMTLQLDRRAEEGGYVGFLLGAGQGMLDHRGAAMIQHQPGIGGGLLALLETSDGGALAFQDMSQETPNNYPLIAGQTALADEPIDFGFNRLVLNLEGLPTGNGTYDLRLTVWAENSGTLLGAQQLRGVPSDRLLGNIALVSHGDKTGVVHAIEEVRVGGDRIAHYPGRAFGPIAGTLYSLSGDTLKLSAQFMHMGEAVLPKLPRGRGRPRMQAELQARPANSVNAVWQTIAGPEVVCPPDYYVPFRVEDWDSTQDWQVRVVTTDADEMTYTYEALVAKEPEQDRTLSVAAFTGMGVMGRLSNSPNPPAGEDEVLVGRWTPANVWMPFEQATRAVARQDVDLLFFTGDQIYEGKPTPTDTSREPKDDYLYKWLLWHWSFRDLTRRLPAIVQTDDHDVYHGNLWGWGGRLNSTGFNGGGGYLCSPYFVNMVHRTQTGHNPDAYDPRPLPSGITNYYCDFAYGGVGFAVLEDRKFKVPSSVRDPAEQVQLGAKQLEMLDRWSEDWTDQQFKCVVSQTIYAGMHTNFNGQLSNDTDTNAFPKVGRDRAVRLFQRCGAFVISGDQHLGTFGRLGLDAPSDAVYQMCTPALANIFWRWFYPATPGTDRTPGEPPHLGEFIDGWGNYFRMVAVANPEREELLNQQLRQRYVIPKSEAADGKSVSQRTCLGDGYAIVRFDKGARTVRVECWPHNADVADDSAQFPGWPVTLEFDALDGRRPVAWLPDLEIEGAVTPVVQIIDQTTGQLVKVTRAQGGRYSPGVFHADHTYRVRVGEPGSGNPWWEAGNLRPAASPGTTALRVPGT